MKMMLDGLAGSREARRRPVDTLLSGPAAGVLGAFEVARRAGRVFKRNRSRRYARVEVVGFGDQVDRRRIGAEGRRCGGYRDHDGQQQ